MDWEKPHLNHWRLVRIAGLFFISVLTLFCFLRQTHAGETDDRYTALREEEVRIKESKVSDFSARIESLQRQVDADRQAVQESQEKVWKEFSDGLEIERKGLRERLDALDERQRLFEKELERKREQDELQMREKQAEVKRLQLEMERLRSEVAYDRKALEQEALVSREEIAARQQAAKEFKEQAAPERSEELENGAVKVSRVTGGELFGETRGGPRKVQNEYYVTIGDTLFVEVWRVPDLTRDVTVRPDGRISMPIVGDLDVAGMNLIELRDLLSEKFRDYVRDPQVSLSVRQFGGRKFIILGEVPGPGVYRYQQDVTLVEAIALAGGFKDTSRSGKILIIRGDIRKDPQVKIISANVDNVFKRGMLSENLTILPNDIIYVTKDFLGDYKGVLDQLIRPTLDTGIDFFVLRSAIRTAQDRRN